MQVGSRAVVAGKDFDPDTGEIKEKLDASKLVSRESLFFFFLFTFLLPAARGAVSTTTHPTHRRGCRKVDVDLSIDKWARTLALALPRTVPDSPEPFFARVFRHYACGRF